MYPTQVKINYDILTANFRVLKDRYPEKTLSPIVKADAYGHGLVKASQAFIDGGATQLSVFRLEEAQVLRDSGISVPIWVLLGALPYEVEQAVKLDNITLGIASMEQAEALSRACVAAKRTMKVHIAVDTGMGRLGFLPDDAIAIIPKIAALPGIEVRGVYSHVAKPDEPQFSVTQQQVTDFRRVVASLPASCTENHLCASVALLNNLAPELHYARPGIVLYAETILPGDTVPAIHDAMSVTSRIISLKDMPAGKTISYSCLHTLARDSKIAVVPIGYDDGLQRCMSNRLHVLVHGKRVPQLGRICMSMIMVDVTDVPGVAVNDEVVILGNQLNEKITVNELTELANTTQHEFLCTMGRLK